MSEACLGVSGARLGLSGACLGVSEACLGVSGACLGVWDAFWGVMGAFGCLGLVWVCLGRVWIAKFFGGRNDFPAPGNDFVCLGPFGAVWGCLPVFIPLNSLVVEVISLHQAMILAVWGRLGLSGAVCLSLYR